MKAESERTDENIRIGQLLRNARRAKRFTQRDMMKATGVLPGQISMIERGECKANVPFLLGYCRELKMTPNEILRYTDDGILPELNETIRSMDKKEQELLLTIAESIIKRRQQNDAGND